MASYPGDGVNNKAGSGSTNLTINQVTSTTTVVCAPSTLIVGQPATCSATVSGYNPTGIINWQSTDRSGIFSANPCMLNSGSCGVSYTPTSSATITASYSGDQNNIGGFGTFAISTHVNELIQVVVANSGPPTPLSLSGCFVSPNTIVANGTAQKVEVASACSLTVTLPSAGVSSQYVTSSGLNALTIGSCNTATCQSYSAIIYYQTQNTYQAFPKSPSAWGSPGTIVVNGTQLGSSGQTVCSIKVSTGAGEFSCEGWTDYNTQALMGFLQLSQQQRWASPQSSFTDTSGGNQHPANYFLQVLEGFSYSVIGSSGAPSSPTLSFTSLGSPNSSPLIGSATSIWLDSGSSWAVPQSLTGSSSTERWQTTVTTGAATANKTATIVYYHQFLVDFGFSIVGGGTAYVSPLVQFTSFGAPASGTQNWVDAGSPFNYTNPLAGSTSVERWLAASPKGTVSSSTTVNPTYYHQFAFNVNFTVSGGGAYNNPRFNFTAMGVPTLQQLSSTQSTYWLDATTPWSINSLLPSSNFSEQWITTRVSSGTATSPFIADYLYYHQYLATIHYSILGSGGSPPVPSMNFTSISNTQSAHLNKTATTYWMDAGSSWVAPVILPGIHDERWLSNMTVAALVDQPFSTNVQYAHQFFVSVEVSTPAGGQVANTDQWRNQGDTEILNATSAKFWSFAYWKGATPFSYNGTMALPTLLVTGTANETAIFFPGLTISAESQGSVSYSYGKINGTVPAGASMTIYPPPGRNVTLTAIPDNVEIMFGGWTGVLANSQLQSSVAISSPGLVHASFALDYTDIRTFAIATLVIFVAGCYVFVIRRGFAPKIRPSKT